MNLTDLETKLAEALIDRRHYTLDGTSPILEGYVLDPVTAWKVSYFERGQHYTLRYCGSEVAACELMYSLLLKAFGKESI